MQQFDESVRPALDALARRQERASQDAQRLDTALDRVQARREKKPVVTPFAPTPSATAKPSDSEPQRRQSRAATQLARLDQFRAEKDSAINAANDGDGGGMGVRP